MRWVLTPLILLIFITQLNAKPIQYQDYYAHVVKVIDGDTVRAKVKVWPGLTELATVRIRGIDTPELRARCKEEKVLAILARDYLRGLLKPKSIIRLKNIKLGKYAGRVIATVMFKNHDGRWVNLSNIMIVAGYGRAYNGGKRKGWC